MEKKATSKVLKKARKELILRILSIIIYRSAVMIIPILFSSAINNISTNNFNRAVLFSIIAIITVIIYRLFDVITTYTWHKLYNKMYDTYTDFGIKKTFNNSIFSLSRINMGEYLNIMNNDINIICSFYCDIVLRIVKILEIVIIFVYFFMINLYIGLAGVAVSIICLLIIFFSKKKIEIVNAIKSEYNDKRSSILNEFLLSIKELKSLNLDLLMFKRINESTAKYSHSFLTQRVVEDISKYLMLLFIEMWRWGLFIYGIYLIKNGQMEIGTLLIIYNYYAQLIDGFSEIATINNGTRQLKVSEDRFNKLVEYSQAYKKGDISSVNNLNGQVKFNNVLHGFRYSPLLNNISFIIKSNSITCIVGNSGSGKTAISDLLLRLNRQHEGEITIDDININTFSNDEYYNIIGSVSKNPIFLNLSIKENLSVVETDFEKIIYLCKTLEIHNDIIKLKNGYNTILNSSEDTLNPMVKSLLGIARILLKSPKIMIFDEIFNDLNKNNDKQMLKLLEELKIDHTIIIITKETHILNKADNIIVIDNGKFITSGKYDEIKDKKEYKKYLN